MQNVQGKITIDRTDNRKNKRVMDNKINRERMDCLINHVRKLGLVFGKK